jgi:hypothetical protein
LFAAVRQASIELERVVEAANGAEALTAFESNAVDLILSYINMPVWTGWNSPARSPWWKPPKGVVIVILGNAWTVTPIAQAAAPVQGPAATPVATKTPKPSPAAVLKPTVVKSGDLRLQP